MSNMMTDIDDSQLMPPPPVPSTSTSTSSSQASTSASGSAAIPAKKEKRKLACAACRARRIRCEWVLNKIGCVACSLAELKCPGEPEPRKRQKKGENKAASTAENGEDPHPDSGPHINGSNISFFGNPNEQDRFELGGALTFHLIELTFTIANPCIPGLEYDLYRMLLNNAGGTSREMEVAAESMCMAFIAAAVSFSDHQLFIGPTKISIPFDQPSGIAASTALYDSLVPFGARRREAVDHFALRSFRLFQDSKIKEHPGVETIYVILAMDHSLNLANDGKRRERGFIDLALCHFRHLCEREIELNTKQKDALKGPLARTLLNLDAQAAAILGQPLNLTDEDLEKYYPDLDLTNLPAPTFDAKALLEKKEGWRSLGKQLAPIHLKVTKLYRDFVQSGPIAGPYFDESWSAFDGVRQQLERCERALAELAPMETKDLTNERKFDLISLINFHRRNVLRLELLIHQRIVDQAAATSEEPSKVFLELFEKSQARIKQAFKMIAVMAKEIARTSALIQARRLFEMLEVCLIWTSMRNSQPREAALMVLELGITKEMGQAIMSTLALAAWSSGTADIQRVSLRAGLNHIANPLLDKSTIEQAQAEAEMNSKTTKAPKSTKATKGKKAASPTASTSTSAIPSPPVPNPAAPQPMIPQQIPVAPAPVVSVPPSFVPSPLDVQSYPPAVSQMDFPMYVAPVPTNTTHFNPASNLPQQLPFSGLYASASNFSVPTIDFSNPQQPSNVYFNPPANQITPNAFQSTPMNLPFQQSTFGQNTYDQFIQPNSFSITGNTSQAQQPSSGTGATYSNDSSMLMSMGYAYDPNSFDPNNHGGVSQADWSAYWNSMGNAGSDQNGASGSG